MDKFFKLKALNTTVRTEIIAGITTFMTMAYILVVNPSILSPTGLSYTSVFLATALAAGIFTIAMGLFVNFPVALGPGMGLNAFFASTVLTSKATGHPITPQMALSAVFISGIIFFILTVTKVRQLLIIAIPDALKHAITVGLGLFITTVAMKNAGLMSIVALEDKNMVISMGSLQNPQVWLTIVGVLVMGLLLVLNINGAILLGMILITLIGAIPQVGLVDLSTLGKAQWIPNFNELNFWHFNFADLMSEGLLTAIATFTFVELFDTFGTLVGTANRAGFFKDKEKGNALVSKAMFVDAVAVSGGAVLGTSTVTAFVESSAGVGAGGRSGLTSVTTGSLMLLSLFLLPIALLVPAPATSSALIIVGVLMMQSVREIDFYDLVVGIPAFLTIVFMPLTYNIANGISIGLVFYVILGFVGNLANEKKHSIHWLTWVLLVIVVARYIFIGAV